ncbi:Uncharacterised protein [Chlamydia trachomatis]|nr:Uncharacterised protein [Chlamydia trachomatis]
MSRQVQFGAQKPPPHRTCYTQRDTNTTIQAKPSHQVQSGTKTSPHTAPGAHQTKPRAWHYTDRKQLERRSFFTRFLETTLGKEFTIERVCVYLIEARVQPSI